MINFITKLLTIPMPLCVAVVKASVGEACINSV